MFHSVARIETPNSSKYLQQLCKHFAHKVSVDYNARRGDVAFPPGPCVITAEDGVLSFDCRSEKKEGLTRMQLIIEDHLVRFAWREEIQFVWEGVDV